MSKWVYSFGAGHNEGKAEMRNLLGGKGANLAEMARIGLPIPPGFTITTEACTDYYDQRTQTRRSCGRRSGRLGADRRPVGDKFGDTARRCWSPSAPVPGFMPGMMDTF